MEMNAGRDSRQQLGRMLSPLGVSQEKEGARVTGSWDESGQLGQDLQRSTKFPSEPEGNLAPNGSANSLGPNPTCPSLSLYDHGL